MTCGGSSSYIFRNITGGTPLNQTGDPIHDLLSRFGTASVISADKQQILLAISLRRVYVNSIEPVKYGECL